MQTEENATAEQFFAALNRLMAEEREWRATHSADAIPVPRVESDP